MSRTSPGSDDFKASPLERGLSFLSRWSYRFAAMLAVLGAVAHEFAGGPMVLPPLQESDLQRDVIALHHFSWHVGSVAVLTMGGMFAFASKKHGSLELAVAATAMSAGFSLLAFGLSLIAYGELWGTPAPYVWSVITVVGAVGVWCHFKARNVI